MRRTVHFLRLLAAACLVRTGASALAFTTDRRRALTTALGGGTAAALTVILGRDVPVARAAEAGPTKEELSRIVQGYKQINYLLDHFDEETTVCKEGGGGKCKRDSDAIRKALGLRTTTDPLFQIDKVFAKIKNMDGLDPDRLEQLFDATEEWSAAMAMSNSMAYVSQFGEYNPGGGEDNVLKYLLEAKTQVVAAQKALKTIVEALGLDAS